MSGEGDRAQPRVRLSLPLKASRLPCTRTWVRWARGGDLPTCRDLARGRGRDCDRLIEVGQGHVDAEAPDLRRGAGNLYPGDPNGGGSGRKSIISACENSLRRLQTDYIDLYWLHMWDKLTPIDETMAALDDLVRAGKVRYIGASNYPAWRLMEALGQSDRHNYARFVSYQPQYSLMERAGFEIEAMPLCRHHGLGVMPYSPLARGFLTGKYRRGVKVQSARAGEVQQDYANERGFALIHKLEKIGRAHGKTVAQTALAWLLTNPVVTAPIIGANTTTQLQESLGAAGYRLNAAEMESLHVLTAYPRNWRPIWD